MDLLTTFDTALTGCMVVFTCLDQEIQKLSAPSSSSQSKLTWRVRARLLWKEDKMKEYLSLIRGQQTSLSFLIQLLQMQSIDDIYRSVETKGPFLQQQATKADTLRKSNPSAKVPDSVLGVRRSAETLFGDAASTVAATEFEFDDIIINSKAYRRAMHMARVAIAKKSSPEDVSNELDEQIPDPAVDKESQALEELRELHISPKPADSMEPTVSATESTLVPETNETPGPEERHTVQAPLSPPSPPAQATANVPEWRPSGTVTPIELDRRELGFKRPFNRTMQQVMLLRNPNPGPVVFKVKVTAPKLYCVRPNFGRIEAGSTFAVLFEKMEMDVEPPPQYLSRDKFLIQSIAAAADGKVGSHAQITAAVNSLHKSPETRSFVQEKLMPVVYLPSDNASTTPGWY